MRIIARTIYGAELQTALQLGLPYTPAAKTTLNEKFDIQANADLQGDIPHVHYFCIGNKGHQVITGADGIPYTSPIQHRAKDAALFNHIPFVVRKPDNDLSIDQRENYALRKREVYNGEEYVVYYLKRIDLSEVVLNMEYNQVVDGDTTTKPFTPTNDALNPTQPEMPNSGVITTDGTYLSVSAIIDLVFNDNDVQELINVARVIYDNEQMAVISEIGLSSGIDRVVSADNANGQSFNYREAIAVQIATHITGYYPVGYTNQGFSLQVEAGSTEPMLGEGVK